MHYRRRFYRSLLEGYELGVPNPAKINVLDAMNLAISAWTMDVSANYKLRTAFVIVNFRSTDKMTFEKSDEGGESTQESPEFVSQATISNTVKRPLEYLSLAPERGDVKRHKPAKFPDLEKSLYEWILQYQEHVNMTTPEVLTMLRKIKDEIQGEIDFNKKQKTIESFFKKPS
ncbi:hypothetical protein Tco_1577766 [Tanacetum coccineum]